MKHKRRALFQSVISLLLCFSMLVGTTFAWFTDSVSSGRNTIAAGTLDVELYHSNAAVTDEKVDAATELFKDLNGNPILWEPGAVSYENLRIANEGDLALAYQLLLSTANENHVVEASGAKYGLSQILKVGVVEGGITATDRAGVVASVEGANWTTLASFMRSGSLLPEGDGESEKTWGIVVYWQPGEYDNYWNLNNGKQLDQGEFLMLDLGIKLIAAQAEHESDAFGTDYDKVAATVTFPVFVATGSVTTPVVPNENNQVADTMLMTAGQVSASIPAGVQLAEETTALTMTIAEMGESGANLTLKENEAIRSLDVHIEGVGANNTVPITVTMKEIAPKGLNIGNYKLYHVETDAEGNKTTNEMTLVDSAADFTEHNQFKYDPATGDIVLYMATFSEVAVVADTKNAWEGGFDYSWYNGENAGTGTETDPYIIVNADQLAAFGAIVGGMKKVTGRNEEGYTYGEEVIQDSFSGKTVKLIADINLGDAEAENNPNLIFYPIGYYNNDGTYEKSGKEINSSLQNFCGTFDGQGHKISNFYQNTWEMKGDNNYYDATLQYYRDGMGLFGRVYGGTVKNLTVDNFKSDGEYTTTGCIAAYADCGATFENIAITNCNPRVYNIGNGGIVGCVGWYTKDETDKKVTFSNITVDKTNTISALWGSYDVACGGIVGQYYPTSGQSSANYPKNAGIHFENCNMAARMDVYNDVCGNYQYYAYRYAGMMIGSIRENETIDGHVYPKMDGISATNCTVNYGDWNDYYYCEFETNGKPSYAQPGEYKFSRVDNSLIDTSNGKENATCKHENHTKDEDQQAVYLPFHQLFTGYGWGVTSKGVEDFKGIDIINIEVTDQNTSETKFVTKFTGDFLYRVGTKGTVSVGTLFDSIKGEDGKDKYSINGTGVYVSVTDQFDDKKPMGSFEKPKEDANKDGVTDWKDGQITFNQTGIVKVTIQDYDYCKPTVLYLEVVDAVNTTTGIDAKEYNVVLLNNISNGFTVSGNNTVYGNGFTLNYTGDGRYLNNGLKQGVVTVSENGTLDNLKIKASIYPSAFMYYGATLAGEYVQQSSNPREVDGDKTRYYYQLSAVVAKGNATISNCDIYGGRTNVFVDTGDVTITDSILECGTVANVQIQSTSAYTVTMNNVTTIQYPVNATVGDTTKVMLGTGVLVGPDTETNPTIVLNGAFKQYNWVTKADMDAVSGETAKTIIKTALETTAFNHTVNGQIASNLGIIYMNQVDANVENNTGLPYVFKDVDISSAKGKVYSLQNAEEHQMYTDYVNANHGTANGDVIPTFKLILGNQEISYDGSEDTRYLYGDANGIFALYQEGDSALTLDLSTIAKIYKYEGKDYPYTAVCKDSNGNTLTSKNNVITLETKGDYKLEFTIQDNVFYNNNGQTIEKVVERTYTVPLNLVVKAAAIKNAVVNISQTALSGEYTLSGLDDYKLRINFLDAISVTDYDNKGNGTTVSLSSNIASATLTPASVNVFTTASTITITYKDGRVLTVNLSKISGSSPGTKTATVNTSGYFITDGALNNKPTESSSQNKCTITSVSFKGNSGSVVTNDTDVTVTWDLGSSSNNNNPSCLAEGTLITLADGSKRPVEDLRKGDMVMSVDHLTGKLTSNEVIIVVKTAQENYYKNAFVFDDGTKLVTINEHGIYDLDINKYVNIDHENYQDYIGHRFVSVDTKGNFGIKRLVDVETVRESGYKYDIVTNETLNYVAEDTLSVTHVLVDVINSFDFAEDLKYDVKKVQADIETYGLYTYDEWSEYCDISVFNEYNIPVMKVGISKGMYTKEYIIGLINTYVLDESVQIID